MDKLNLLPDEAQRVNPTPFRDAALLDGLIKNDSDVIKMTELAKAREEWHWLYDQIEADVFRNGLRRT